MANVFLTLLHRSIAAGWLILAVLLLRACLRRAPKWVRGILWGLVAVRLVCPFSIESPFSLMPSGGNAVPAVLSDVAPAMPAAAQAPADAAGSSVGTVLETAASGGASGVDWAFVAGIVWLVGAAALLGYALVSWLRLRNRLREAVPWRDGLWLCDFVRSPFVLGVIRPRIYLPSGGIGAETDYVVAHERAHLKRGDHWWKPLAFCLLAVYWFNPLVWAAYVLFCRDIELACDERVVREMDLAERKAYSGALISCGMQRRMVLVCPLAFGEVGVKQRVKAVLNYKKPVFWIVLAALAVCAAAAVCFLTDPKPAAGMYLDPVETGDGQVAGYDFQVDDKVQALQLNIYELSGGVWELQSYWRQELEEDQGRIELEFSSLASGLPVVVRDGHGVQIAAGELKTEEGTPGLAAATAVADRTDVAYGNEIPLAIQVVTAREEIISCQVEDFQSPQELAQQGYEHVYAVTVCFSEGGKFIEAVGGTTTAIPEEEDLQTLLGEYEAFGVTMEDGVLYYQGERVRYFLDGYENGDGVLSRYKYYDELGTVDIHTERNDTVNGDGSTTLFGPIADIVPYPRETFDQREYEAFDSTSTAQEDTEFWEMSLEERETQWAENLQPYLAFGLTYGYDVASDDFKMYYNGTEVQGLYDEVKDMWITEHTGNRAYSEDAVELYAVYDGLELVGLRKATAEEQEKWTALRQEAQAEGTVEAGGEDGLTIAQRLEPCREYGLTYEEINGSRGDLYYNGRLLEGFWDDRPDGTIFTTQSATEGGAGTAYTIYNEDGELTGISVR